MRIPGPLTVAMLLTVAVLLLVAVPAASVCNGQDSRGDAFAESINQWGRQRWGPPPQPCDDLTFARRVYLDLLGRVPSVSELRDFQSRGNRRGGLIDQLVFESGATGDANRLSARQLARHWRSILISTSGPQNASDSLDAWLTKEFASHTPFDKLTRRLIDMQDDSSGGMRYFRLSGGTPESFAGNVSRSLLGVRIECAQCHDHPFTDWKQEDFWGMAAFYAGSSNNPANGSTSFAALSRIKSEGIVFPAKLLGSDTPILESPAAAQQKLQDWLCSAENPLFAANTVNRMWQYLVGKGLYEDVENLDQATPEDRRMLDQMASQFTAANFSISVLLAGICKSDWYQAISQDEPLQRDQFYRPLKTLSSDQVFDSLEQSLHLPIGRLDDNSPRWSGARARLLAQLRDAAGVTPEEYQAGIPQALAIMNGSITAQATSREASRLLRAIVDAPFITPDAQVDLLYMSVVTRRPNDIERSQIDKFLDESPSDRLDALGELLWALLNSPEFVLCR